MDGSHEATVGADDLLFFYEVEWTGSDECVPALLKAAAVLALGQAEPELEDPFKDDFDSPAPQSITEDVDCGDSSFYVPLGDEFLRLSPEGEWEIGRRER